ncbi:MAG: T9SS type A sorting domain-containing protein [Crocinitomix sp.]|nr:T9SS type A sorting domain-containing protein [Crocinitomix sp.]
MKLLLPLALLLSSFGYSQCAELFFSEYIEGSSSNKAFEIYNPTAESIDLTDYVVYRNNNGSFTPTDSLFPQGVLPAAGIFVVANPSASASILAEKDTTHTMTFYNGDDALWLKKISTGDTLDIIGDIGVDPGSGWPVGVGATNNFTLIRMIGINEGQTNWAIGATEWDVFPINMIDSLGSHTMTACPPCETSAFVEDTVCDEFISPSGEYTWTETGTYMDTILNVAGCDSVITFDLTVYNTTGTLLVETACDGYPAPSGDEMWTESGLYMDTIPNIFGCDSVITVNLTVNYSDVVFDEATACDSLISPSGLYVWTENGTYNDTLTNMVGCDSVLIMDVTIIYSSTSIITVAACKTYTSPSGNVWTSGGAYTDTIPNHIGCDSIITIGLTIYNIDVTVTQDANELMADNPIEFFQWLNCDDGYSEIPGETEQLFIASENGNYAVEITQDGCIDTSACYAVTQVGIKTQDFKNGIELYPNPNKGDFMLELANPASGVVNIRNIMGQVIATRNFSETTFIPLEIETGTGIYFVEIVTTKQSQSAMLKFTVN